jgi:hypothetical protein
VPSTANRPPSREGLLKKMQGAGLTTFLASPKNIHPPACKKNLPFRRTA